MDFLFRIVSPLFKALIAFLIALLFGFVVLPLVLAEIARQRNRLIAKDTNTVSSLYVGRVWHTRLIPKKHAFNYPLFLFALDLEEVSSPDRLLLFADQLWPLSWIVNFRDLDHLKNGEGLLRENGTTPKPEQNTIAQRVLRLVAQKTNNKCQPTLQTHRVMIVTHLCYYGYCFNPVSFYYLQDKITDELSVVVAEVSNTPWNEMHCYVLHKDSTDQVQVQTAAHQEGTTTQALNFKFPKKFHVSPFMEMDYMYDWTFYNFVPQQQRQQSQQATANTNNNNNAIIKATASMKRDSQIHFTANMEVFPRGMHPHTIAWQLIYYPIYCFIIQLWIHYEAFRLFVKGIVFVPHPNDAETAVSRAIAAIMTPLFAVKDWVAQFRRTSSRASGVDENGTALSASAEKAKTS